ncbi:hydrolase [Streptomyces fragilis]|uniref:Hydrolase n=1 Tax=Streptomyces fragilis TaxID=67301 RepID=A0ABV2YAG3_9ACTN|nr:hydrolase [Streptomyces fragilis]
MSRRRPHPRRRRGTRGRLSPALVVTAVLASLVGAGIFLVPTLRADGEDAAELTVRYRTAPAARAEVAAPWLEVVNTSDRNVRLSDVVLRYHFRVDDGAEDPAKGATGDTTGHRGDGAGYGANCVRSSVDCSLITRRFGTAEGGLRHLEAGFSPSAGTLRPGESSKGIGLQLYRLDHGELDQTDDPSYDAALTRYAPSRKVSAYLRGKLVWGDEPGRVPAPAPDGSAGTAGDPPDGVLFDDFHYTGPADPALAAGGWQVRTGAGGPGIKGTWTRSGIAFPAESPGTGDGGSAGPVSDQVLRLRAGTDGSVDGTRQAEIHTGPNFRTGTLAARVRFSDRPAEGHDGDHISQAFFAISPNQRSREYSELDYEYLPNGGWGALGPRLDTTSWRDVDAGDRVTRATVEKLGDDWHTLMITAVDGTTEYSVDGRVLFRTDAAYFPREAMGVHFSAWFVDLPFQDAGRAWDMEVDWLYLAEDREVSLKDVRRQVRDLSGAGSGYVDTLG